MTFLILFCMCSMIVDSLVKTKKSQSQWDFSRQLCAPSSRSTKFSWWIDHVTHWCLYVTRMTWDSIERNNWVFDWSSNKPKRVDSSPMTWWLGKPVELDGPLEWSRFEVRNVSLGTTEQYVTRKFLEKCLEVKCLEKPWKSWGSNHTAPIRLADRKHCAVSTQPNPTNADGDLAEWTKRSTLPIG